MSLRGAHKQTARVATSWWRTWKVRLTPLACSRRVPSVASTRVTTTGAPAASDTTADNARSTAECAAGESWDPSTTVCSMETLAPGGIGKPFTAPATARMHANALWGIARPRCCWKELPADAPRPQSSDCSPPLGPSG